MEVHSRNRRSQLGSQVMDQVIQGDFRNGEAQRARFENCRFNESPFAKSNYYQSEFVNCSFFQSNLSQCNFRGALLDGCTFDTCDLDQTDFEGATIYSTMFIRGRAQYSIFHKATVTNVRFDTDLHGADLRFRSAEGIQYGESNLWAASININCNSFQGKRLSERQVKILLALISTSEGNDELRESVRELAGPHYVEMMKKLTLKGSDA